MPVLISPIEESEVLPTSEAAGYAAPATPVVQTVIESPGYAVPEELTNSWVPGYVPVVEATTVSEEGQILSSIQPPPNTFPASAAASVVTLKSRDQFLPTMSSSPADMGSVAASESMRKTDEAETFIVDTAEGSPSTEMCHGDRDSGPDLTREGPFDVDDVQPEPGQSPLVLNSMPGCQFRMTSHDDSNSRADLDPAYGIHLHDPRILEYMGEPESARLLGRSPEYWVEHMGRDRAVAAALRLHHDASLIMTNVKVLAQFVTGLNRTSSEVMRTVYEKEPFLTDAVEFVTPGR